MIKRISAVLVLLACTILLATGCMWQPGTGTLRIVNRLTGDRVITNLLIFEAGSRSTGSSISTNMHRVEYHVEYGLAPGKYIIEAEIDDGAETAVDDTDIDADSWCIVWINNWDIQ